MKEKDKPQPSIIRTSLLTIQVCIPETWNDEQIIEYVNTTYPSGTKNGWMIVKEGDDLLAGHNERVRCSQYSNYVHVLLTC